MRWKAQPFEDEGTKAQKDRSLGQCVHLARGGVWIAGQVHTAPEPGVPLPVLHCLHHTAHCAIAACPPTCSWSSENQEETRNVPRVELGFTANSGLNIRIKAKSRGLKIEHQQGTKSEFLGRISLLGNYFTITI